MGYYSSGIEVAAGSGGTLGHVSVETPCISVASSVINSNTHSEWHLIDGSQCTPECILKFSEWTDKNL